MYIIYIVEHNNDIRFHKINATLYCMLGDVVTVVTSRNVTACWTGAVRDEGLVLRTQNPLGHAYGRRGQL